MTSNEFQKVGLYEHNAESYKKIKRAYERGQNVAGIVHATGTGKTYNALELAYDNKDKKIIYVVPSTGIIEHIKKMIEDNPNLDLKKDFPNLEFRTYQSFISLSKEEIQNIQCDLLILDEFHHIGAPVWGARINTMIETHPNMKIFGMTAYTIRDRGTSYERDMAADDSDELFSNKIESRYDLCDAMIDGILPKPIYKSAYINLMGTESKLEERVQKLSASSSEYQEYMEILSNVKKRIHEAPSIPDILRKNIKPNGKYIYFCPPCSEDGTNDIETIKKQAIEWFKQFVKEEDIVIYTSTSDMREYGKLNRDAFYKDITIEGEKVDNKLRIMFAINQYNEGIHAPNIDGVIMGRGTSSDIVYFEQLGRALSVRGNTKETFEELEKHSVEELTNMCKSRDIPLKENQTKEELIEKLIAPVVIDLTNNYEFIKELENNLKNRIKTLQSNKVNDHRVIKIKDATFDIEIVNQDLFEMLRYVSDRLTSTWEDFYYLAKAYFEHYGNLNISARFATNDGYTFDDNGVRLGKWVMKQKYKFSILTEEQQELLKQICLPLDIHKQKPWKENYKLAKAYYEHYGNLSIPVNFKTRDGYTYDENGINLGNWVKNQRKIFSKLPQENQQLLSEIAFVKQVYKKQWLKNYELAKTYYEHYGNLLVPVNFKTKDGYTYDESGVGLGKWVMKQKYEFSILSEEQQELLKQICLPLDIHKQHSWEDNYKLAKAYYEHYGNLSVPVNFKTRDGYTYDENGINLGNWVKNQRKIFSKLPQENQQLLSEIAFVKQVYKKQWLKNYELAKTYYEHYGNLLIPVRFKTKDGYTYDENGTNLGNWINWQKSQFSKLTVEHQNLLKIIGFVPSIPKKFRLWEGNYKLAKAYYEHYGNLSVPLNFKTKDGCTYDENGIKLGKWLKNQKLVFFRLSKERQDLLRNLGVVTTLDDRWLRNYELAKAYYEHFGNMHMTKKFKTSDGFTYDENGVNLRNWINYQIKNCDPDSEHGRLLSELGVTFNVKKTNQEIMDICASNNIDTKLNKTILTHISLEELTSKIEFLKEHNLSLTLDDGKLSEIFSLSNKDMQEKYGISLEKLISKYSLKSSKAKSI